LKILSATAVLAGVVLVGRTGDLGSTPSQQSVRLSSIPEAPETYLVGLRLDIPADSLTAVVQQYCVNCHNDERLRGNLTLEDFEVERAVEWAETAEKMIVKLRAGMMPLPGARRPSPDTLLSLVETLESLIDEEAAAKVAPHDLKVGEIICENWGASMNRPSFLKVVEIPHPRKVMVVRLKDRLTWGDRQVGSVVPVEPHEPETEPFEVMVTMETGDAQLVLTSLSRAFRWNGKPASITSD